MGVEDEGEMEKALGGFHVGDVRRPEPVWCYRGEAAPYQVGDRDGPRVMAGGAILSSAQASSQPDLAHQLGAAPAAAS
jgi:hypothetical protein